MQKKAAKEEQIIQKIWDIEETKCKMADINPIT